MKITFLISLSFIRICVFAQQITTVQAASATASQGTAGNFIISYTIGEMPAVQSLQKNGLFITQGILQPVTSVAAAFECFSNTEVNIYPNPSPGIFTLQLSILARGKIQTQLLDAAGRLMQAEEFDYNSFLSKNYNISRFAAGNYLLLLWFTEAGKNAVKKCTYSIQKLN